MSDTTAEPEAVGTSEVEALLQRVRKLEETVEELRDTTGLENRIVKRLRSRRAPADEPEEQAHPPEPAAPPSLSPPVYPPGPAPVKPPWLLFEMFSEFKNMVAMLFDMRFRIGWTTRAAVIVILGVMMTGDWLFLPLKALDIITFGLAMKFLNLILAFILFKILTRETRRYMAQRG